MGAGVSGWRLARAVSTQGQLGVLSGTALAPMMTRQLELGDEGGHLRRALAAFPLPDVANLILEKFFIDGGKPAEKPFSQIPFCAPPISPLSRDLTIASSFSYTFLAKEGHGHPVGINLLEKIQVPTLLVLFGAMLAGVDVVLVGAGIPRQIPDILDHLACGQAAELRLDAPGEAEILRFDPAEYFAPAALPSLSRPKFLAIVSSPTLAAATTPRPGADQTDRQAANRSTVHAMPSIRLPSGSSACPSGWREVMACRENCRKHGLPARLASRSAPPSPSARNRASIPP